MKVLSVLAGLVASASAIVPLFQKGDVIPGSYIVVLSEDVEELTSKRVATDFNAQRVYNIGTFHGFSANLDRDQLATLRSLNGVVKYVESNQVARASFETQRNPTWGVDRVDQARLPLDSSYKYFTGAGAGVDTYIVDTGILNTHVDFNGRSYSGYNFVDNRVDSTDDNGHGTHCAGSAGSTTWGLAKNTTLYGVKVLSRFGSGSYDNVIAGVNFVADEHRSGAGKKTVSNMSLGGGISTALDAAIKAAVESGVVFVVASGNDNANACNYSPARNGGVNGVAISVNAADSRDARATFSNFGTCTDIFAPGVSITSTWHTSNTATNTISGTSMAAPHVAGAAAIILGQSGSDMSPSQVKAAIKDRATMNVITNPGTGSTNANLYSPYQ